jgi:uncharacterized membrane protein
MTTVTGSATPFLGVGSDRRFRIAILVIGLIGLGIATYLTIVHYTGLPVACATGKTCATVQSSVYAKLAGIPVPVLGLIGYLGILGTLALADDLGRIAAFGLALVGFLFSAYLTYREIFTIKAICEWCVGSAICMTVLLVLSSIRVLRAPDPQPGG